MEKVFGAQLINLDKVYHGIATPVNITAEDVLFKDLPKSIEVGRYHSWVVKTPLPASLEATSFDDQGQLMSLRHKTYDVRAVQYHPESVLTPHGKKCSKIGLIVNYENPTQSTHPTRTTQ